MSKVVVFDYGAGNLRSVLNTLGAIGAQYELVDDVAGLESAEKIIRTVKPTGCVVSGPIPLPTRPGCSRFSEPPTWTPRSSIWSRRRTHSRSEYPRRIAPAAPASRFEPRIVTRCSPKRALSRQDPWSCTAQSYRSVTSRVGPLRDSVPTTWRANRRRGCGPSRRPMRCSSRPPVARWRPRFHTRPCETRCGACWTRCARISSAAAGRSTAKISLAWPWVCSNAK